MRYRLPIFQLLRPACRTTTLKQKHTPVQSTMSNPINYKDAVTIYDFCARDIKGEDVPLREYDGRVAIIVNVASQCGYTQNHYEELNELYDLYGEEKGLKILAFPCNQFAGQEPGNSEEICSFVSKKNVKFDLFEKVDVNGSNAHPLWKFLKHRQGGTLGDFIKWNFTKFIIDKQGQPVARFGPNTSPKEPVEQTCGMASTNWKDAKSIYEFNAKAIRGEDMPLSKYKGHVTIIVNVASQCQFTENHYQELNELYDTYSEEKGLKILAFPCNQFAEQEPGDAEEICAFASKKNVKFDLFEKIDVNGSLAHPLWKYLKRKQCGHWGDFISWNFTKFVIDKQGQPVARFEINCCPKNMLSTLEKYW